MRKKYRPLPNLNQGLADPRSFFDSERSPLRHLYGELHKSLKQSVSNFQRLFGITQVRAGLEMEFWIAPNPKSGTQFADDIKSEMREQFKRTRNKRTPMQSASKRKTAQDFNTREMIMVEMHERFPDILEERFAGKPVWGKKEGYYDGTENLELRIKHGPIEDLSEKRTAVLSFLAERLSAHGYQPDEFYFECRQPNISFWDKEGDNLCDILICDGMPTMKNQGFARTIAQGLLFGMSLNTLNRYTRRSIEQVFSYHEKYNYVEKIDITGEHHSGYVAHKTANEENRIYSEGYGRFEIRKPENFGPDFDQEDFDLLLLLAVSGAELNMLQVATMMHNDEKVKFKVNLQSFPLFGFQQKGPDGKHSFRKIAASAYMVLAEDMEDAYRLKIKESHFPPRRIVQMGRQMGWISPDILHLDQIKQEEFLALKERVISAFEDIRIITDIDDQKYYVVPHEKDIPGLDKIMNKNPMSWTAGLASLDMGFEPAMEKEHIEECLTMLTRDKKFANDILEGLIRKLVSEKPDPLYAGRKQHPGLYIFGISPPEQHPDYDENISLKEAALS